MNNKKIIYINTILLFLLMFISHNLYKWLPNDVFAIFFPVNESIWEHMKMIYTTIIAYIPLELIILNKLKINNNNLLLSSYIAGMINIIIELILFVPIYKLIGENLPITLVTLLISIFISQYISFNILDKPYIKNSNIISIFLIIFTFILMGILTYNPPKNFLFFDPIKEKYGINIYEI